ncbi:ABC transporter [Methylomonas lenta]|uniref:ABC transporter n=2 Tax=Methylomonas lenta TaxID=980561 RepID=A0A177NI46_9GAMM|nr:ABC transporter [Methylomonas lenta]
MDLAIAATGIKPKIKARTRLYIMQTRNEQSNTPIIVTQNLGKSVPTSEGELHILSSVDVIIKSGESIAIVGESGSGKTTLLSLLAGLDTPSTGSVSIKGRDITLMNEDGRAVMRNELIGFVFQSFQLLPGLTALENVMLPLELSGDINAAVAAKDLLQRVGLSKRLEHTPKQLSGGEQQRVALARAFVTQPAILFADEPTGNLDSKTGGHIIDLLFELNQEKHTTLVLVTHDATLAARCERVIKLDAGSVV